MESSNLAISALVPTCRTHKHYRYYIHDEGRGHGRPGEWEWSESEGPPSGLQRLRPSGSDPGARHLSSRLSLTFSAWKDLRKDIPQSIFEKSNTALLRAVTLKWNKFDLQCATFRVCEECKPFTRLRASIVQPPNFLPMSVMRVWFSMTLVCHQRFARKPWLDDSWFSLHTFIFYFSFNFAFLWPWYATRGPLGDLTPTVRLGLQRAASEVTDPPTDALLWLCLLCGSPWNFGC